MGGDEIVADWLGDVVTGYITSSTTVQRFSASSLRVKSFQVWNTHATEKPLIGKYHSNVATFVSTARRLTDAYVSSIDFEFVDLYNIGVYCDIGTPVVRWIGINQY